MKFGRLIEYNIRNILLETLYPKCGKETIPRPFSKKSYIVSIFVDQYSQVLYILLLLFAKMRGLSKVIESKLKTTCFYLIWRFFKKQNEVSN